MQLSVYMNRMKTLCALAIVGALSTGCAHLAANESHKHELTAAERIAAIHRAQVWSATNIPAADIKAGPARRDGFAPDH